MRRIQRFEVSLKAFLRRGEKALFLRERDTGYWELPGGRIEVGEEALEHSAILLREIAEELGPDLQISFDDLSVTWTRAHPGEDRFVFLIARVGDLVSGDLRLSDEHDAMIWADAQEWRSLQFPPESGYVAAVERLWYLTGA